VNKSNVAVFGFGARQTAPNGVYMFNLEASDELRLYRQTESTRNDDRAPVARDRIEAELAGTSRSNSAERDKVGATTRIYTFVY